MGRPVLFIRQPCVKDEESSRGFAYHCKSTNSNATNGSSSHKSTIVLSRGLDNSADVEDDHDQSQSPLPRDLVGQVRHENTAHESTEQQHGGHEAGAKGSSSPWEGIVELVHDVDDGDDALVIAEGEASERGKERGSKDVGVSEEPTNAVGPICYIISKDVSI